MKRREDEIIEQVEQSGHQSGIMIKRNPCLIAVWTTILPVKLFKDPAGGQLFNVGEPSSVTWWKEGRHASRSEVMESITTGIPILRQYCDTPSDHYELGRKTGEALKLLPAV
jgi:hypothetical protein